ncbi:response regulator [Rhodoferax antarcticus]|uniref:Response regulator domain protein n=1 Tax=Rhodoferax antarcticus ANT.BR TaxID=1111071 RepID=A0A1Q8YES2_9BURK|nr:HD domain-containing phosphohydrolase [Rhodoferax antarcticus]APW46264.1 two-component system response regulator [Rhodoferax antarcticus]MCW2313079.1 putative two-component system response regulator [Rhodoferax antarcticus]OLP06472.1 response regulator domain protein [Rhodoferax antarcticus ANT.BR]
MTYKVLIVDDAEINLVLFEALLKRMGNCESASFSNAVAGLVSAQTEDYDLVIVDYMMPELNGVDFITQFRQTPGREDMPVLMITANDQKQVRYRALDAGATDFLTKPVDKIEFMARVKNMLQLGASRKVLADRAAWLAEEVRKATYQIKERERETVIRLSKAAEYRDPETGSHIVRMAHYSELIARGLGMPREECELLLEAAPMHDIGKVGITDSILLKPGRLTPEEFEAMKLHSVYGYDILKGSSSRVLQTGAAIALGHHEKFDGSGYPGGLKGEAIPIFSRIAAVADVFDALTSERPYKKAWSLERASEHIKASAGSHLDPQCVTTFFSQWESVCQIRQRFQDDEDAITIL